MDKNKILDSQETTIWEGKPSQWINFKVYAYCVLMTLAVFIAMFFISKSIQWWVCIFFLYPAGRALFAWYEIFSMEYKLTDERLIYKEGIFNRVTTETELSQIKEVCLIEPWYKRIVKLGDIKLNFFVYSASYMMILGVHDAEEVKEIFNRTVKQYHSKINQITE